MKGKRIMRDTKMKKQKGLLRGEEYIVDGG